MNFYLKSPYGSLNLDNLERCLKTRVSFFMHRQQNADCTSFPQLKNEVTKNFDCLVMGSSYDIVGHFMLRLLTIYSSEMKDFLIQSEIDLFKSRLDEEIVPSQFIQSCRITSRHIDNILGIWNTEQSSETLGSNEENVVHRQNIIGKTNQKILYKRLKHQDLFQMYLLTLRLFCKSLRVPQVVQHFLQCCNDKCASYHITVPFQTCLNLVSKRKIHLIKGKAKIFCCNWKEALVEIFEYFFLHHILELRSNAFTNNYIQDDLRMIHLFKEIKLSYIMFRSADSFSDNEQSVKIIKFDQVDKESVNFSPCIANVHKILRTIHRLKHNDRFYFSLFLKNIGMTLNESILFWKAEYSQVSCCSSVCSHSWQKNERKYIYGIRHLYGLEGSRKRYSAPDCQTIQSNMHVSNLDHSCPFLYPNDDALIQSLSPKVATDPNKMDAVLNFRQNHTPLESCRFYMSLLTEREGVPGFESPTGYYFGMKSLTHAGNEPALHGERSGGFT
uniref:DNA primase large subunit n=1 Tax=Cacopsylla melanoneura TaxID=428564 RepID=A0A8D8TGQ6_9HEMI